MYCSVMSSDITIACTGSVQYPRFSRGIQVAIRFSTSGSEVAGAEVIQTHKGVPFLSITFNPKRCGLLSLETTSNGHRVDQATRNLFASWSLASCGNWQVKNLPYNGKNNCFFCYNMSASLCLFCTQNSISHCKLVYTAVVMLGHFSYYIKTSF